MKFVWEELVTTTLPTRVTWDPVFYERATVLAVGLVFDEWPGERWSVGDDDTVEFLSDETGVIVGFDVLLERWDPDALGDADELWDGPRFWVPQLGLREAAAGEVLLAARARWGDHDASLDAWLFNEAAGAKQESLEKARDLWTQVIDAGDLKGVFGLGYTLYDMGRYAEAHAHLRHYTELAPMNAWAWCWLGKALEALGETGEAAAAYARAIELEDERGMTTDAPVLLERLGRGGCS